MATILPVPGKRRKRFSQNCLNYILISQNLLENWQKAPLCSEYFVCKGILQIRDLGDFSDVFLVNGPQVKSVEDCHRLYPDCAYTVAWM